MPGPVSFNPILPITSRPSGPVLRTGLNLAQEIACFLYVRSMSSGGPAADSVVHSTIHVARGLALRPKGRSARIVRARLTSLRSPVEHYLLRAGRAAQATSIRRLSCPFARPSTASSPRITMISRISQFSSKGSEARRFAIPRSYDKVFGSLASGPGPVVAGSVCWFHESGGGRMGGSRRLQPILDSDSLLSDSVAC